MRKVEVKIRQILWAIKQSFKATTYDLARYRGEMFYIKSSLTGEGVWDLFEKGSNVPKYRYVKGKELKIIHSFGRFVKVLKSHLRFQETSWGSIDRNRPIGRRLCYHSSDDIRF